MKRSIVAFILMMFSSSAFSVGIPVVDVTSIAQQIIQVSHLFSQIKELKNQLETAKNQLNIANLQLDNISGSRGLGSLIDTSYDDVVDVILTDVLATAGLNDADANGLLGVAKDLYNASNNDAALFKGQSQLTRQQAQARFEELLRLVAKVDDTPDQKDVLDLQARAAAESALLQNEQLKLQTMDAEARADEKILQQQKIQALVTDIGVW